MAKFNISSQSFLVVTIVIFLIMASTAPPSLSRKLISSSSSSNSMVIDHQPKITRDMNSTSLVHSTTRAEFEGDAHEVPSGPNPISNDLVG